jgi:hypothetical protein
VAGLPVNDKVKTLENDYMKAKDEILSLLRERGDVGFLISFLLENLYLLIIR